MNVYSYFDPLQSGMRGTSVALFAPAWTFESEVAVSDCDRQSLKSSYCSDSCMRLFSLNEERFWCGIPYFVYQTSLDNDWQLCLQAKGKEQVNEGSQWKVDKDNQFWV